MVKKLVGLVLICILVFGILTACTGPQGPAGPPGPTGPAGPAGSPGVSAEAKAAITVIPSSGKGGDFITVIGAGFELGEELQVWLVSDGPPMLLGLREPVNGERLNEIVANEYGTFKIVSKIPRPQVTPAGVYTIEVTGDQGSYAVTPLEVVE
jgi:hypothetical protein